MKRKGIADSRKIKNISEQRLTTD